jgi:hypothetical protein
MKQNSVAAPQAVQRRRNHSKVLGTARARAAYFFSGRIFANSATTFSTSASLNSPFL